MLEKREFILASENDRLRVFIRRDNRANERRGRAYHPGVFSRLRLERALLTLGPRDIYFRIDGPVLIFQKDKYRNGNKQPALF